MANLEPPPPPKKKLPYNLREKKVKDAEYRKLIRPELARPTV